MNKLFIGIRRRFYYPQAILNSFKEIQSKLNQCEEL